jgi:hypothetical protein
VSSNAGFVELNLSPLGYVVEVRIFLLVLVSFTLGVATSKILTYLDRFFALIDLSDFLYRRKIKVLEKKITELKNNRVKYENNKLEIKNDSNKE